MEQQAYPQSDQHMSADAAPYQTEHPASTFEKIAWQILVDGKTIKRIISFQLDQSINAHHRFELKVYHTELESPRAYRIDQTRELIGKNMTAVLGTHNKPDITRFSGIITEVGFAEKNGLYGEITLKGYSPTILLESGPHLHSFYNKNLNGIVEEVTKDLSGKLEVTISPRFTGNIEYTAQHRESHFEFLNRLSDFHGEWFYYDGEKLLFGKPSRQPEQQLLYARHIEHMQMSMQAVPMNFNQIGYRSQEDQALQQQTGNKVPGLNFYGDIAVQKSDELFTTSKDYPWQYVNEQGNLSRITQVNKSAQAAQTFFVHGNSRHPSPRPGMRITIRMSDTEIGEYLVTEAVHTLGNVNDYNCLFRALPADIEVLPKRPSSQQPVAEPQIATVRRNDDPTGQGRVRVQFQWQEGDNLTPWIRVMTPDAGSSGVVNKNRGFVFIPEIGDQVMVGFEQGNPDAPFVLGSLFHGRNGIGGGTENITKSIMTRSGHTIELNDNSEGTHIIIRDPGGNEIFLDTQGKNITITAPETITLNAKNINLNAGEHITCVAGENISGSAGENISLTATADYMLAATNITEVANENMSRTASSIEKTAEQMQVTTTKENIELHSSGQIVNKSGSNVKLF